MVLGTEQENHILTAPAQGPDELRDRVVYVVERGVSPHTGAVEQVTGNDGNVGALVTPPFSDRACRMCSAIHPPEPDRAHASTP